MVIGGPWFLGEVDQLDLGVSHSMISETGGRPSHLTRALRVSAGLREPRGDWHSGSRPSLRR